MAAVSVEPFFSSSIFHLLDTNLAVTKAVVGSRLGNVVIETACKQLMEKKCFKNEIGREKSLIIGQTNFSMDTLIDH